MKKRIVIVSPYATVAPHFETELEIAQRHLDQGDWVTVISCLGELSNCDFNVDRNANRCNECRLRRADGWRRLDGRVKQLSFEQIGNTVWNSSRRPSFKSIDQLKQYQLGEFDLGYASLSSLVSSCRDPQPDLLRDAELLTRFFESAREVYTSMLEFLDRYRPDCVYVFNGRFASMRGVLRACQAKKVECQIHERGCDTYHYQLYRNRLPHEIAHVAERMKSTWQAADPKTRHELAAKWFEGRVKREERNWHSFVKHQQIGKLPAGWDSDRHNVAIFTSSEDEFVAIGDCWNNQLYSDQLTGIVQIARALDRRLPQAHLTVRIHPNLSQVDNVATRSLLELERRNLSIVGPDDPVDSYHLMRTADTIATFGSSIGIEAVYWSKPSVLLGPCFYQDLGGVYRPDNHESAIEYLVANLSAQPVEGALIYGYWQQTHGIRFEYFEPSGLFSGTFKGEIVYPRHRRNLAQRLSRHWHSIKKRVDRLIGKPVHPDNKAA